MSSVTYKQQGTVQAHHRRWTKTDSSSCSPFPTICFTHLFFFLNYLFIYLFIFGCVGSSFLCEGFLQLRQAGATLIAVRRPLTIVASLVAEHRLQTHRLSSCGSRA